MSEIKFGTDGWRAVIAEDFTFANVERVAQAVADFYKDTSKNSKIVIGYDTRFLSNEFAKNVAAVLSANGFKCIVANAPTPTPAVSLAVKDNDCVCGIMLTASHNPPKYNGIKIKSSYGGPAMNQELREIENRIDRSKIEKIPWEVAISEKLIQIKDLRPSHLKRIKKMVDMDLISRSKLTIAHDAMFGTGAGFYKNLLSGTRRAVYELNNNPDPLFGGINPEPIPENYSETIKWLMKNRCDVCLVNDGDADRIGAIDGSGRPLTSHEIICLVLIHLIKNRKQRGKVVKAITTTSIVDKISSEYGLDLIETKVGFKHICEKMFEGDVMIGCEESGSIGFGNYIPERDGLLGGAMLLELLSAEGEKLNTLLKQIEKKYGKTYYRRVDLHINCETAAKIVSKISEGLYSNKLAGKKIETVNVIDGAKIIFTDDEWLMFRASGTEHLLRIYSEANSVQSLNHLIQYGVGLAKKLAKMVTI
ncbi:MAG: phosphoglucomutase/phosphomannomutase family protein [Verrucomicrobiia bacterium]